MQRKLNDMPNIVQAEVNFKLAVNRLHGHFVSSFGHFVKAYGAALW